ncbi:Fusaric acid resistance protein-like-domain-containing protein [Plectosphaerella plurivora]|uniref:Fusaric acid resistance protein-like-domain-containing protein n=1 Tax=Plectosphaerella plurivora TaxID=936078 RepID=A0A9P8V1R2_9PEZI|nr:Fusaric acid resistance protein-like-domain-containing protein [Plectosphaerella plurivora]
MSSSSSNNHWPPRRPSKRGKTKNGTVVIPSTGEHSHRNFTLRSSFDGPREDAPDLSPTLSNAETTSEWFSILKDEFKQQFLYLWVFLNSPDGHGVLNLATYLDPISDFLGKPDGKHVVATITVYFHAHRTWGSMVEAILLAICAIIYAQAISIIAMGLSLLGTEVGIQVAAHVTVLFVCIGFGLGFLGWIKTKMNNPLVNVACTLASINIITIVTKEEAVQDGYLSSIKVVQICKILILGVSITFLCNLIFWRTSARSALRGSMGTAAVSLGDMLAMITRSFLNGSEDEMHSREYSKSKKKFKVAWADINKNLKDAKIEHYIVGREAIYGLDREVVRSMEVLSQAMGGLKSAAETQFALLKEVPHELATGLLSPGTNLYSPTLTRTMSNQLKQRFGALDAISEEHELGAADTASLGEPLDDIVPPVPASTFKTPTDIFEHFMVLLGPSMKSLAFTLSEILREPAFGSAPKYHISINSHFRQSLKDALSIYNEHRSSALLELYKSVELGRSRSEAVQADFEEVAAACGHFSFSLQNVAEDIDAYLTSLEDLKFGRATHGRSWKWIKFWKNLFRKSEVKPDDIDSDREALLQPPQPSTTNVRKSGMPSGIPAELMNRRDTFSWDAAPNASVIMRELSQKMLKVLRFLARDDIRFGIKVGAGAMLWAMMAFLPSTRPVYKHWRGEWGLLSYMIVTSMTVGAANTTGTARSLGTLLGGVFALIFWALSAGSAVALAFCGWLVSLGSFYTMLVLNNPPLGRTTLLAWNVTVLYAYSLMQKVEDDDDDEGGTNPLMGEIVYHRLVSVNLGIVWGIIVCRAIWPISGRRKFKEGLTVLYLQLGLIWKRGPLAILLRSDNTSSYMKDGEEKALQRYASKLDALRSAAKSEFELRGPFPNAAYARIMGATQNILDGFHAMRLVTSKRGSLSPGERALLRHTAAERAQLCDRICHIFEVLASSFMLEYPLTDAIPSVSGVKDRLLGKIHQFRAQQLYQATLPDIPETAGDVGEEEEDEDVSPGTEEAKRNGKAKEKMHSLPLQDHVAVEERDYALLYAYTLVTSQVAHELEVVQKEVEELFGTLNTDALLLR